jgi:hypothetical protein
MRLELALILARRDVGDDKEPLPDTRPAVRRRAGAQFLHCGHDVRTLFGPPADAGEPAVRDLWLVVLPPRVGDQSAEASPRVLELSAELHAALLGMQAWHPFGGADPLGIGARADVAERLVELGILEVAA